MKGRVITQVTPQNKMVAVNAKFGNANIAQQQGTTRVLFDSLLLDGSTQLRFFDNASSRQYPYTNIGSEGNRLTVGDTFTVQKIYFAVGTVNPSTGAITAFQTFIEAGWAAYMKGEFNFEVANSQVIKQLPLEMFYASLNPTNINQTDSAFSTFTDVVIPPLLEYVLTARLAPYTGGNTLRLFCFMEGSAAIISPQSTF